MDTPAPGVVKDSQRSLPNVTPKSANFGSPLATQNSWTAPPRRRPVQQKAKPSFLPDEYDEDGEDEDEEHDDFVDDTQDHPASGPDLDSMSLDRDSGQSEEDEADEGVYNQSPTPCASQAAHLPPQSAQPVQMSSMLASSDTSSVFEALKEQSVAGGIAKGPSRVTQSSEPSKQMQQQKGPSAKRGKTAREGIKEPPAKLTAPKPKTTAKKSFVNSKAKLSALEVEIETDTGEADVREPVDYDYSLPASNSNSPAAPPAKKRAAAKKQPVKKPVPKSKSNAAPKAKSLVRGATKNAKSKDSPPVHQSSEAHPWDGEDDQATTLVERDNTIPLIKQEVLKSRVASTVDPTQDAVLISSDSTSSSLESDNEDDEDFECSLNMIPRNSGRKTRAAAQMQAAKGSGRKIESQPAAMTNPRGRAAEEVQDSLDDSGRQNAQSKQQKKTSAVEKTRAALTRDKPTAELMKETDSSAAKIKTKSAVRRQPVVNSTSKSKGQVKEDTVVPSSTKHAKASKTNGLDQSGEPSKSIEDSHRKPNIVTFGPNGPKTNGKSHRSTTTGKLRPQGQQSESNHGKHPRVPKTQLAIEGQKVLGLQSAMAVEDGDGPAEGFAGTAEGGSRRAALTSQAIFARSIPGNASHSKLNAEEMVPHLDEEMTGSTYGNDYSNTSDQLIGGNAKAEMAVEDVADAVVVLNPHNHQKQEIATDFKKPEDRKVRNTFAGTDNELPQTRGQRIVLKDMSTNSRTLLTEAPADVRLPLKRKLPEDVNVHEPPLVQHSPMRKSSSQSGVFHTLGQNPTAANLPSRNRQRPEKKPRYSSAQVVGQIKDAIYATKHVDRGGNVSCRIGGDSGDDVFGPEKDDQPFRSSAFVQRLISNESTDREPEKTEVAAPSLIDARAASRQYSAAIRPSAANRPAAAETVSHLQDGQQSDDIVQRVLAALAPREERSTSPCPSSEDHVKSFDVDKGTNAWLDDSLDQRAAAELNARTRAWKKATEPYADSIAETMHRIVNTILRSLKTKEAAIVDVIEDYRTDGKRVVERMADKHRKERSQVIQQQEQNRLRCIQTYGEARRFAGALQDKLESVDVGKTINNVGKDATTNHLKQLQQAIIDT
ncbi:hypothetical protein J7T55_015472 [Diaporthe amygdali]|uniref:uncharacterized protein n=1 Tax=Phomopsis amygdali TaxID=1214568 RepID=UPI0022FE3BF0|nr:uncharacterized protein J7T55_015472 [Diaporthe amygdali]KAJ0120740.1 hypothetical protein J7T55_015472 [Diaporthe amygdali]